MRKKLFIYSIFLLLSISVTQNVVTAQSIVNTEKLFTDNDDGFAVASEFIGSFIRGNADVLLLEYSLNFAYRKGKNSYKLLSAVEPEGIIKLPSAIDAKLQFAPWSSLISILDQP